MSELSREQISDAVGAMARSVIRSTEPEGERVVYFIECAGYVKIGSSTDRKLDARLNALQVGSPVEQHHYWLCRLIFKSRLRVAAWGVHGRLLGRGDEVRKMIDDWQCLGRTQARQPRHPLYVRGDTPLEEF